jgi:hypothetical protein
MSDRVYSEREIAALLERAVERQEAARRQALPEAGLTLSELERLGQEVGIAPEHLRAAARELDAGGATGRQSGRSATHVYAERWVPGTLSLEGWEDAVAELNDRHGTSMGAWYGHGSGGAVQQIGRSHEWSHTNGLGIETRVTVSERGDRVRLRLAQKLGHARSEVEGPLYGALAALTLVLPFTATLAGSAALAAAITFAAFVLFSGLIYVADRRWRDKKHRALEALADDLGARLVTPPEPVPGAVAAPAVAGTAAAVPAVSAEAPPLLALDAIPDVDDVELRSRRARRTRT